MSKNYNQTLQLNNSSLEEIKNIINNLPDAGGSDPVLQDKTVTPTTSTQTITADSGYDGLDTVTVNAMPTATQATPSVTVNASGLITATATQTSGYVAAGTKSATQQLAFQVAKTITPTTVSQIAVSSGYYVGGDVTVNGDSNLVADNIKSGVSIFGVSGTYEGGGGVGDSSVATGLIDGHITSCTDNQATRVKDYAFYSCKQLTAVGLPACTSIGSSAFYGCSSLATISFPACTSIYSGAFTYCSNLTTINFPVCKYIGSTAFLSCVKLTTAIFPACISVGNGAFRNCTKLTTVSLPTCKLVSTEAFISCKTLTTISLPVCSRIFAGAFSSCPSFNTIYLMSSSICALSASTAFSNTGITKSIGSIYVPASLVDSYKSATNWTYFSNRIFGV